MIQQLKELNFNIFFNNFLCSTDLNMLEAAGWARHDMHEPLRRRAIEGLGQLSKVESFKKAEILACPLKHQTATKTAEKKR